jgi:uncharacterized protein YgbK (DUF1537 family)
MAARVLLAAIADDFTGGSDMAGMLAEQGVRTVQTFGIPDEEILAAANSAEAVVVSLKTRSIPARDAVAASLEALEAIRSLAPRQIQFKYCSTFDSTREGNIGPVTSALMEALRTDFTIAVPALPVNGRTQYLGYLFVNGVLLSESPMRNHPLNPMTEPNLVRHLQAQTSRRVGLVALPSVRAGLIFPDCKIQDCEIALVDAIEDTDLTNIAEAVADLPLMTGGSGITSALPTVWKRRGMWSPQPVSMAKPAGSPRRTLLLAGSCSAATLRQIEEWTGPAERMRTDHLGAGEIARVNEVARRALEDTGQILVYSSAPPEARATTGAMAAVIECAFGDLARALQDLYDQIIVAGGETSGAVIEALGVRAVRIGPAIDPGVPALRALSGPPLALALKSGNFGSVDFFAKATRALLAV